jgi:hypothetical protein
MDLRSATLSFIALSAFVGADPASAEEGTFPPTEWRCSYHPTRANDTCGEMGGNTYQLGRQ